MSVVALYYMFLFNFATPLHLRSSRSWGSRGCCGRWGTPGSSWEEAAAPSGVWRPNGAGWIGTGGTGWAPSWAPSKTSRDHLLSCQKRETLMVLWYSLRKHTNRQNRKKRWKFVWISSQTARLKLKCSSACLIYLLCFLLNVMYMLKWWQKILAVSEILQREQSKLIYRFT